MLNSTAFANASAVVTAALFIICRVAVLIMPDFIYKVGQSWFHTIRLDSGQVSSSLSFGMFMLGLISATALIWLITFAVVTLYNKMVEK